MVDMENIRQLVTSLAVKNRNVNELQFIRDAPEDVEIINLPQGFINFTFRVRSQDKLNSLIVKHYKDHLKSFPAHYISLDRVEIEYEALKLFNSILPDCCPAPYCLDKDLNIVVMEDLDSMTLLRDMHLSLETDILGMGRLAEILAKIHRKTSKHNVTAEEFSKLRSTFTRSGETKRRDYIFIKCLDVNDPGILLEDEMKPVFEEFISNQDMVDKFYEIQNIILQEECLIHGDCHDASLFLSPQRCAVFDMEFAGMGHRAIDVAHPLITIVTIYNIVPTSETNIVKRAKLKEAAQHFLERYVEEASMDGNLDLGEILATTAGISAVFLFRTSNFKSFNDIYTMGATFGQRAELMSMAIEILTDYKSIRSVESFVGKFFKI